MKEIQIQDFEYYGRSIPVFIADKTGKLVGLFVAESNGYIGRIGGGYGISGHFDTIQECATSAQRFGYRFFINEIDSIL